MPNDLRRSLKERLGPFRNAADEALAEALIDRAIDITHENGTPEGTYAAVLRTLSDYTQHQVKKLRG